MSRYDEDGNDLDYPLPQAGSVDEFTGLRDWPNGPLGRLYRFIQGKEQKEYFDSVDEGVVAERGSASVAPSVDFIQFFDCLFDAVEYEAADKFLDAFEELIYTGEDEYVKAQNAHNEWRKSQLKQYGDNIVSINPSTGGKD